jgi:hypothetical protein
MGPEELWASHPKQYAMRRQLQARGLSVSDEVRARVLSCSDATALDLWAERAISASHAEDIFATG